MPARRVLIPLDLNDTPPPAGAALYQLQGETMGTGWSLRFAGPDNLKLPFVELGIRQQLDSVIAEMSPWEKDSVISHFNRAEAGSWHELPADFFTVLEAALATAASSGGAFDPTIAPLVNLWGFGPDGKRDSAPPEAEIAALQSRCGWQRLELDEIDLRVRQAGGITLDLSGIAKGFAVDKVSDYLLDAGFPNHLIEIGGELRGRGLRPDGHPWWVQLEPLPENREAPENIVALHNLAVATSGDYRKFFVAGEQRYAHTLDPRTGRPVMHGLAAVSVLHEQCMLADAQATVLMVLGVEDGMNWAIEQGVAAILVERHGDGFREHLTPVFADMLE